MKSKILLSALFGGALLAGCTADDALEAGKVAQQVNPAAPVFTVSFDDETQNRATMDASGQIFWQTTDKMSLYHGGGQITQPTSTDGWKVTKNTNSNFLASGEVRKFDAIYSGSTDGATFTTQSMVNEGLAIMIYPADTTYIQKSNNPHIIIPADQNEQTKFLTPYVSEVLRIGAHEDMVSGKESENQTAGFGRTYPVKLRRVGGQLRLALKAKGEDQITAADVPAVEFRKVQLNVEEADYSPFTTELEVKVGQPRTKTDGKTWNNEQADPEVGKNQSKATDYWMYSPWLEPAETSIVGAAVRPSYISTTDINTKDYDMPTAIFTLLKYEDREDNNGGTYKSPFVGGEAKYGEVTIKVNTTYGSVALDNKDEAKWWTDRDGTQVDLTAGLTNFLQGAVFANSTSAEYKNQLVADRGSRTLTVDLSTLNMNYLHIENETHLMNALKVYDVVYAGKTAEQKKVTFILDGAKEGTYKNKFVMTEKTWKALEARLAKTDNYVSLALCNANATEKCTAIVLDNTNGSVKPAEVPVLKFETDDLSTKGESVQADDVTIEFVDSWAYTSVTTLTAGTTTGNEKGFVNVGTLKFVKGSSLVLENKVAVKTSLSDGIVVENGANVTVDKMKTDVHVKLENHGTITIGGSGELRAAKDGVIENCADEYNATSNKINGLTASKYGKIYNYGILGLNKEDASSCAVNNYGLIEIKSASASTQVSTNAKDNATVATQYSEGKYFGVIVIDEADETKTTVEGNKGFIKKHIDAAEPTEKEIGDLANYIILNTTCKKITADDVKVGEETVKGLPAVGNWATGVKYIEVVPSGTATPHLVDFIGTTQILLEGLIVPEGARVDIARGSQLTMHGTRGNIYMQGTIVNNGTLKYGNNTNKKVDNALFNGYFGQGKSDVTTIE